MQYWCNRAGLVKSAVLPLATYDNILAIGEIGHRSRFSYTSAELGNLIKYLRVRPPGLDVCGWHTNLPSGQRRDPS
jgi:hypothetical protein